jgi:hypothetical protein
MSLADPNTAHALQHSDPNSARKAPSRQSLPSGPCNYRDAAFGSCGCDQFWDKCNAELHDESKELPSSDRSTWCVCGHHACFHLRASRAPVVDDHPKTAQQQNHDPFMEGLSVGDGRFKTSHSAGAQRLLQQDTSHTNGLGRVEHARDAPSQASTSGFPSIPSVCRLSYDQLPAADSATRHGANQSRQTVAGLGLSAMQLGHVGTPNQYQSPSRSIPDGFNITGAAHRSFSEPELASTRANSIAAGAARVTSPSRAILDHVLEFNRTLQVDVAGDTIPNTYNPYDYIQSATEVATPSVANTPDLGAADQAVEEGKNLIDTLTRLTSDAHQENGTPGTPSRATSAPAASSLTAPQEQLQHILQSASPQALNKLISYLAPLHNLLVSIPNVANTMRDHGSRLDMLENGSFNYVQPEDFNQALSMYDDRLGDVENRMDEHDRHHRAMDADQCSSVLSRRRIDNITTSFGSNHSLQSTTSSALVFAAVDRKDIGMEIGNIKDRLDMLEAAALPTALQPWEIEVVLIPWGRDLRGIWFSNDEPMHDMSKTTTQGSEEWTQARNSRLSQKTQPLQPDAKGMTRASDSSPYHGAHHASKGSVFGDTESGWSSQAISEWASGSSDDWLFPKACGSHNLTYKRLQSRGFVRNITLKSASARDLQATLSVAFNDLLEHLSYSSRDGDDVIAAYPGLRASFIPLRKVHKESKLRFLTPAEMSSSALWSAQFLAAGVMMRVSGGKKRLYVTQRESYIQHSDDLGSTWTWQELRQLPRFQHDQDSPMEGNDEHCQPRVAEGDAKETCWQHIEAYDAPPASIHSSFGSHHSVELTVRPAADQGTSWRRSVTPSVIKHKVGQPISPLSEFHPRPAQLGLRTASASVIEQDPAGSSKRRHNSSPVKQSSAPQPASRTPSVSVARLKRRRTTHGPSIQLEQNMRADAQVSARNPTPRRSREPPSPFYSSNAALPRSNSDVASRPSQRSVAVVGKSTPFAYATPHSGPFAGGPALDNYDNGGDTEPDDAYEEDDGEQSWRGVTDGDDDAASSSDSSGPEPDDGAQYGASFSGDESGFGSESGYGDDEQHEPEVGRRPHHNTATDDDAEDGDVLDTLLDVLEH